MQQRELGRTGLKVSALCLGTMTFGEQNTERQAHAQLDRALAAGINSKPGWPINAGFRSSTQPTSDYLF